jgi:hypothetical protein
VKSIDATFKYELFLADDVGDTVIIETCAFDTDKSKIFKVMTVN